MKKGNSNTKSYSKKTGSASPEVGADTRRYTKKTGGRKNLKPSSPHQGSGGMSY